MNIELNDDEARHLREALTNYLSELREEITKTEAQEWRNTLHQEERVLSEIRKRLH